MFAQVITFEEAPDQLEAGIRHVEEEVIPPLETSAGLQGYWLVNRDMGRRLSVMVWANEAASQVGMQAVQAERAKYLDRERPTPTSVQRFEVYATAGAGMLTAGDDKALARRFFDTVINQGNLIATEELCGPGYVIYFASPESGDVEQARQTVLMLRTAFPDYHLTVERQLAEGDMVVSRWTAHGTHLGVFQGIAPTGRSITLTGVSSMRVASGKIVEDRVEANLLGLLQPSLPRTRRGAPRQHFMLTTTVTTAPPDEDTQRHTGGPCKT
jgi:hypothetical protein